MAQDTALTTQRTERAHRWTRAKWPRTSHTQQNAPSEHTGEQERSGPGGHTRNSMQRAGTPVNRTQKAQDTAHGTDRTNHARTPVNKRPGDVDTTHTCACRVAAGRETTNRIP